MVKGYGEVDPPGAITDDSSTGDASELERLYEAGVRTERSEPRPSQMPDYEPREYSWAQLKDQRDMDRWLTLAYDPSQGQLPIPQDQAFVGESEGDASELEAVGIPAAVYAQQVEELWLENRGVISPEWLMQWKDHDLSLLVSDEFKPLVASLVDLQESYEASEATRQDLEDSIKEEYDRRMRYTRQRWLWLGSKKTPQELSDETAAMAIKVATAEFYGDSIAEVHTEMYEEWEKALDEELAAKNYTPEVAVLVRQARIQALNGQIHEAVKDREVRAAFGVDTTWDKSMQANVDFGKGAIQGFGRIIKAAASGIGHFAEMAYRPVQIMTGQEDSIGDQLEADRQEKFDEQELQMLGAIPSVPELVRRVNAAQANRQFDRMLAAEAGTEDNDVALQYMGFAGQDVIMAAAMFLEDIVDTYTAEEQVNLQDELTASIKTNLNLLREADFTVGDKVLQWVAAYGRNVPDRIATNFMVLLDRRDIYSHDAVEATNGLWEKMGVIQDLAGGTPSSALGIEGSMLGLLVDLGGGIAFDPSTWFFGAAKIGLTSARSADDVAKIASDPVFLKTLDDAAEGFGSSTRGAEAVEYLQGQLDSVGREELSVLVGGAGDGAIIPNIPHARTSEVSVELLGGTYKHGIEPNIGLSSENAVKIDGVIGKELLEQGQVEAIEILVSRADGTLKMNPTHVRYVRAAEAAGIKRLKVRMRQTDDILDGNLHLDDIAEEAGTGPAKALGELEEVFRPDEMFHRDVLIPEMRHVTPEAIKDIVTGSLNRGSNVGELYHLPAERNLAQGLRESVERASTEGWGRRKMNRIWKKYGTQTNTRRSFDTFKKGSRREGAATANALFANNKVLRNKWLQNIHRLEFRSGKWTREAAADQQLIASMYEEIAVQEAKLPGFVRDTAENRTSPALEAATGPFEEARFTVGRLQKELDDVAAESARLGKDPRVESAIDNHRRALDDLEQHEASAVGPDGGDAFQDGSGTQVEHSMLSEELEAAVTKTKQDLEIIRGYNTRLKNNRAELQKAKDNLEAHDATPTPDDKTLFGPNSSQARATREQLTEQVTLNQNIVDKALAERPGGDVPLEHGIARQAADELGVRLTDELASAELVLAERQTVVETAAKELAEKRVRQAAFNATHADEIAAITAKKIAAEHAKRVALAKRPPLNWGDEMAKIYDDMWEDFMEYEIMTNPMWEEFIIKKRDKNGKVIQRENAQGYMEDVNTIPWDTWGKTSKSRHAEVGNVRWDAKEIRKRQQVLRDLEGTKAKGLEDIDFNQSAIEMEQYGKAINIAHNTPVSHTVHKSVLEMITLASATPGAHLVRRTAFKTGKFGLRAQESVLLMDQGLAAMQRAWITDKVLRPATAATVSFDETLRIWQRFGLGAQMRWTYDHMVMTEAAFKSRASGGRFRYQDGIDKLSAKKQALMDELSEHSTRVKQTERGHLDEANAGFQHIPKGHRNWRGAMEARNGELMANSTFRAFLRGKESFMEHFAADLHTSWNRPSYLDARTGQHVTMSAEQAYQAWSVEYAMHTAYARKAGKFGKVDAAFKEVAEKMDNMSGSSQVGLPQWTYEYMGDVRGLVNRISKEGDVMKPKRLDRFFDRYFMDPVNYRRGFIAREIRGLEHQRLDALYRSNGSQRMTDMQAARRLGFEELAGSGNPLVREMINTEAAKVGIVTDSMVDEIVERVVDIETTNILYAFDQSSRIGNSRLAKVVFPFGGPWADMAGYWGRSVFEPAVLRSPFQKIPGLQSAVSKVPFNPKTAAFISRTANTDFEIDRGWLGGAFGTNVRNGGLLPGTTKTDLGSLFFLPTGGNNPFSVILPGLGYIPSGGIDYFISHLYDPIEEPLKYQELVDHISDFIPQVGYQQGGFVSDMMGGGTVSSVSRAAVDLGTIFLDKPATNNALFVDETMTFLWLIQSGKPYWLLQMMVPSLTLC